MDQKPSWLKVGNEYIRGQKRGRGSKSCTLAPKRMHSTKPYHHLYGRLGCCSGCSCMGDARGCLGMGSFRTSTISVLKLADVLLLFYLLYLFVAKALFIQSIQGSQWCKALSWMELGETSLLWKYDRVLIIIVSIQHITWKEERNDEGGKHPNKRVRVTYVTSTLDLIHLMLDGMKSNH